jgi:hypothetical protein
MFALKCALVILALAVKFPDISLLMWRFRLAMTCLHILSSGRFHGGEV